MTIANTISKYDILHNRIKAKLDSMRSAEEIGNYLDDLEANILEIPYGDMLHEFACEYAQVCIHNL